MLTLTDRSIEVNVFRRDVGHVLYLVLHRAPGVRYAGQWRVAAGDSRLEELPAATALRVLAEQTGLPSEGLWALDYLHATYDPHTDSVRLIPVFAAEVARAAVSLSAEHDDARWVTYDQGIQLLRLPGQREGLRRAHEDIVHATDRGAPFRVTRVG